MNNYDALRGNPIAAAENLSKRGFLLDLDEFSRLETKRTNVQNKTQCLQGERNRLAALIGETKNRGEDIEQLIAGMSFLKNEIQQYEKELNDIRLELREFLLNIPNILDDDVHYGVTNTDNLEVKRHGVPRHFDFTVKDHMELGRSLGQMDFESAANIAGSKFVTLQGQLCRLQRSLIQFMLNLHIQKHGYTEIYVPYIVNADSLYGTGQLPKFKDDLYSIEGESWFLTPTAEVPVTNMIRDRILRMESLPIKYVSHTPCFRKEAGAYGGDSRGMFRQHQFEKVELVQITNAAASGSALEEITQHAEEVLIQLDLPFRRMLLCSGDTGFSSAKTFDIEVWLPSQQRYREISSCSNFRDFQARRLCARFKNINSGKNELVNTLNGSGLAVGRTLIAILENYQNQDGSITVPEILRPVFGDSKII